MVELIIAEKSDAAKQIAYALSDGKLEKKSYKNVPYYEIKDKDIIVGAAVGHLFNLTEKQKSFQYPVTELEWKPSYLISKQAAFTKRYFDALKFISSQADSITVACDYDTEGSLIGWNVVKFICNKKNAKRMKFSTLTKSELIESYSNASPSLDFPLIESGETRHELDFRWGISSSRALMHSIKNASGNYKILSSGRVQSPILALLTHREKEIENFKPEPYWQLYALILADKEEIKTLHKKDKFFDENEIKKIHEKCKGHDAILEKLEKKEQKLYPLPAFNITSLQTEAYKNFGFSPQKTLDIAERLYLSAYISYPRTSSEKLDPRIGFKSILNSIKKVDEFKDLAEEILKKEKIFPMQGKKIDPAHIAIYPTSNVPNLAKLNLEQKKLYSLIVKRFLACFADPALRELLNIEFRINKEPFIVNGIKILNEGWIRFYKPYIRIKELILPDLKQGKEYKVKKLELKKDLTKPPKRYSQGSIISEMEKRDLGTRATRSIILQTLYDRNYIEDRSIKVTSLGKAVAETLEEYVPELVSEDLTRHFEHEMEQIQEQKKNKEEVVEEAKKILVKIFEHFKKNELEIGKKLVEAHIITQNNQNIIGKCDCGGDLVIKYSKKSKKYFLACSNYPKCTFTMSLPEGKIMGTDKTCKFCGKPVIKVVRKGKRPFEMCLEYNCSSKSSWNKKDGKDKK